MKTQQLHLWLIRFIGLIVPARLRADWRQEWEAELCARETLLAEWDRLNWKTKLDLWQRSLGAFTDALLLQPKRWEDEMIQDLRFGIRMLFQNPGFSLIVILTLAFGIGVNTALFTVFNALVLKPLPLKDAGNVVEARGVGAPGQRARRFSFPDYQDYVARSRTLVGLTLMSEMAATLGIEHAQQNAATGATQPQREDFGAVKCQLVTANYFHLLGAEMALGRGFLPEEERTPNTHPVAVLSHYFWEMAFKSDPQAIGRTIRLSGQPFVIVGVTNKEFIGTTPNRPTVWLPLMMRAALSQTESPEAQSWHTDRNLDGFNMLGRLKPGVTVGQAQAELSQLTAQLAREYPSVRHGENRNVAVKLNRAPGFVSMDDDENAAQVFLILPLSVVLVLLIACANVANLMLARAARRQKEIATRLALGATRWRIIRQLLTESLLIASAGSALGLALAWWTLSVLYPLLLAQFPISPIFRASMAINLEPDFRVFGFTMLMALLAGVAAGLAPAWQASRPNLTLALKGEGSVFGQHLSQSRLRNGLIVLQLAFSLILLVSAGLLARNLQKLQTVDTGYETTRLFTVEADLGNANAQQTETLRQQLEARLRALPDVQSVSRASRMPLAGPVAETAVVLPGQTDAMNLLGAGYDIVSATHLETLGVRLLRGRNFTEQEANSGARVVVVSATAVRKLWPHFNDPGQALGQSIGIEAGQEKQPDNAATPSNTESVAPANFPVYQVIGVTRDTIQGLVIRHDGSFLYLPFRPGAHNAEQLLARTKTDANRVMANLPMEIAALNPNATVAMKATSEWLKAQTTPFTIAANLAIVLGLVALALAVIGLYGVMSFHVAQRTREIGIRVALGAEPRGIQTLFIKQGMRLISLGILIGLLGGAAIARLLASILLDLSPFDPLTFGGVSLSLTLTALLACYLPARRATKVDPIIALRHE
ncbi:MAG: ABC transporter permease [Acidobacteriota bacterium]|nr:ABC transporter permease [Acidobacteriota bacterium]